ncbi:hypothetical protein N8D56_13880 [Devosia sp. A8/3-2]|nr:hypothetical protein N8D56_13880 [Devosia sp. A8/3-2]
MRLRPQTGNRTGKSPVNAHQKLLKLLALVAPVQHVDEQVECQLHLALILKDNLLAGRAIAAKTRQLSPGPLAEIAARLSDGGKCINAQGTTPGITTAMLFKSADEFVKAERRTVTVFGMAGVGKTRLSNMLRASRWFHYSADYRIGTRYMGEYIVDNFKREAMKVPFSADLLRSDSIYISSNITF